MKYKIIGIAKAGSKITLNIEANSPNDAIEKASLKHPEYDFYTTETGEFNTATLITLLNLMSLRLSKKQQLN